MWSWSVEINNAINRYLTDGTAIFQTLMTRLYDHAINPPYSAVADLKQAHRNQYKVCVGELWEEFLVIWLKQISGYPQIYRLKDVPPNILTSLGIKGKQDNGIDIIAITNNGTYAAIQAKFLKDKKTVSWNNLATFIAMTDATGPWERRIVCTNVSNVSGKVNLPKGVQVIGKNRFETTKMEDWRAMAPLVGYTTGGTPFPTAAGHTLPTSGLFNDPLDLSSLSTALPNHTFPPNPPRSQGLVIPDIPKLTDLVNLSNTRNMINWEKPELDQSNGYSNNLSQDSSHKRNSGNEGINPLNGVTMSPTDLTVESDPNELIRRARLAYFEQPNGHSNNKS